MIKEKELSGKKYFYLIGILIIFVIIMMILFHMRSYFLGFFSFLTIFVFWLFYPTSLVYCLSWTLTLGGVTEIFISRKYLGILFIGLSIMFLLGKHVLVEDGTGEG